MIIDKSEQGTPEWLAARAGLITASNFHLRHKINGLTEQQALYVQAIKAGKSQAEAMLFAGYKTKPSAANIDKALAGMSVGEWSDATKNYCFRIAIERLTGQPLYEDFQGNWFTKRGSRLESDARMLHEARYHVLIQEVGLVMTDDYCFGASADGWIGAEEGVEYKAFLQPEKLRSIFLDRDVSVVADQCQGNMAITGRKRWHFGLYCPALQIIGRDLEIITIERNDEYIEQMWADLLEMNKLVEEYKQRITDGEPYKGFIESQKAEVALIHAEAA